MLASLLQATLLGIGAGLAPGPLLALVIAESLRLGTAAGVRVALAPLLTDAPIVALAWGLAGALDPRSPWLGLLSLGGAVVVAHLALSQWRAHLPPAGSGPTTAGAFGRGAAVNALSPHPWLFWMTVGGPLLAQLAQESPWRALGFLAVFYGWLVGTKVALALITGRWGRALTATAYRRVCQALGVVLALFAVHLAWDGVVRLAA